MTFSPAASSSPSTGKRSASREASGHPLKLGRGSTCQQSPLSSADQDHEETQYEPRDTSDMSVDSNTSRLNEVSNTSEDLTTGSNMTPSSTRQTPHSYLNWFQDLNRNFMEFIINDCSNRTKCAVAKNEVLNVRRENLPSFSTKVSHI